MADNILGELRTDTRNMGEQGGAGSIHIHTYSVDNTFDHALESVRQCRLIHVMLIESNPNGLRINFYKFGERILRAARNGSCTANRNIQIREFLARQGRGRIDRSACLINNQIFGLRRITSQFGDQFLGFTRSRTIANADQSDMMAIDHILQSLDRALPVIFRLMWIDRTRVKQLARSINYSDLTPCAKAGVNAHNNVMGKWRLAQERAQIVSKYLDRMVVRGFAFFTADIAFDGRQQETFR